MPRTNPFFACFERDPEGSRWFCSSVEGQSELSPAKGQDFYLTLLHQTSVHFSLLFRSTNKINGEIGDVKKNPWLGIKLLKFSYGNDLQAYKLLIQNYSDLFCGLNLIKCNVITGPLVFTVEKGINKQGQEVDTYHTKQA